MRLDTCARHAHAVAMKKVFLLLILAGPLLGGCMGLASTVTALSHDNATIDFHNVNPWTGTTDFHRSNAGTNTLAAVPAPAPPR